MPIESTEFGTSNNKLRQMPDVKGDLVTRAYTLGTARDRRNSRQSTWGRLPLKKGQGDTDVHVHQICDPGG